LIKKEKSYPQNVLALVDKVMGDIQRNLGEFNTCSLTADSILQFCIKLLMKDPIFEREHFDVTAAEDGDEIKLTPLNLYSLLWLNHIRVTYKEIEGKNEFETIIGKFSIRNRQALFVPIKPLEMVHIKLTIEDKQ
jgi:hypothetical protein